MVLAVIPAQVFERRQRLGSSRVAGRASASNTVARSTTSAARSNTAWHTRSRGPRCPSRSGTLRTDMSSDAVPPPLLHMVVLGLCASRHPLSKAPGTWPPSTRESASVAASLTSDRPGSCPGRLIHSCGRTIRLRFEGASNAVRRAERPVHRANAVSGIGNRGRVRGHLVDPHMRTDELTAAPADGAQLLPTLPGARMHGIAQHPRGGMAAVPSSPTRLSSCHRTTAPSPRTGEEHARPAARRWPTRPARFRRPARCGGAATRSGRVGGARRVGSPASRPD